MENLRKRRKTIKGQIPRIKNYIDTQKNQETPEFVQIKIRLEKLEEVYEEFEKIQDEIDEKLEDQEIEETEIPVRVEIENNYFEIKSKCLKLLEKKQAVEISETEHQDVTSVLKPLSDNQSTLNTIVSKLTTESKFASVDLKLPQINIPEFSGKYEDWLAFHDLFVSLIHDNKNLSNAQKLQFLKSSLKGEACSSLKHLTICDANYVEAWNVLSEKYNKPKYIINAHLKTIVEYPLIQCNAMSLRKFSNTITESIRALKALDLPTQSWDCWLIFILFNKLDADSKQLWARETANEEYSTFSKFIQFLNKREFELQTVSNHGKLSLSRHKETKSRQILNVSIQTVLQKKPSII